MLKYFYNQTKEKNETILELSGRVESVYFGEKWVSIFPARKIYDIIVNGATFVREAGQGRNPAALSEVGCVLFFVYLTIPLKSNIKGLFWKQNEEYENNMKMCSV